MSTANHPTALEPNLATTAAASAVSVPITTISSSVPNPVANVTLAAPAAAVPPASPKAIVHKTTAMGMPTHLAPAAASAAHPQTAMLRTPQLQAAQAVAVVPAAMQPPTPTNTKTTTTKSKSKKKKSSPTVTMATAASAQNSGQGSQGENTGRWTADEHRLFLQGLDKYGKGWKKIACLIKSRTVVQIRTHAQKYFQKLAKARQNGEEGDVAMDARGGAAVPIVNASTAQTTKRRRQTSGTKRKAIQSVVSSAHRQGKRAMAEQSSRGIQNPTAPLPAVAPALSPFVLSPSGAHPAHAATISAPCVPSITTAQGTISGPALEDSLFRFLTPMPPVPMEPQVSDVARQAGANPITLPSDHPTPSPSTMGGEVSPTGVTELAMYTSWTDAKDTPSWYAKGSDVDDLLDVAGSLDWLTDTGDIHETYQPAPVPAPVPVPPSPARHQHHQLPTPAVSAPPSVPTPLPPQVQPEYSHAPAPTAVGHMHIAGHAAPTHAPAPSPIQTQSSFSAGAPLDGVESRIQPAVVSSASHTNLEPSTSTNNLQLGTLEAAAPGGDVVVPPLPSLFEDDGVSEFADAAKLGLPTSASATSIDEHLRVFDSPMEEQDFVSTLLDTNESTSTLPGLE